mmetsp:Transcript_10758/g.15742  ORF Transcript_10758/g.15742 Transcript_10758/m.15742 type:complete len:138 (+) Transcript_10758:38-451(+)
MGKKKTVKRKLNKDAKKKYNELLQKHRHVPAHMKGWYKDLTKGKNLRNEKTVPINMLWDLFVPVNIRNQVKKGEKELKQVPIIDTITDGDYDRVVMPGPVPPVPVVIRAKHFSEKAKDLLEDSGCICMETKGQSESI